jgi:hypothetical protein
MDPSRGKRKNKPAQRGRSVQKPDDNFLQATKEKALPKSQESKAVGECLCKSGEQGCT